MKIENDYDNILVPLDGSKNSTLALERAIVMAQEYHAKLHLVNVIDIDKLSSLTSMDDSDVSDLLKKSKKKLQKANQIASKYNVKADNKVYSGSPKVMLASNLVKQYNVDLIIMGANGLNAVQRVLIGSTAAYVSRVAPCDVLLVKEQINAHR